MELGKAYSISVERSRVAFGRQGHYFAWVGWRSPDSGVKHGPYLVALSGSEVVEVSRKGKFKDIIPATAKHYFPWIEETED